MVIKRGPSKQPWGTPKRIPTYESLYNLFLLAMYVYIYIMYDVMINKILNIAYLFLNYVY